MKTTRLEQVLREARRALQDLRLQEARKLAREAARLDPGNRRAARILVMTHRAERLLPQLRESIRALDRALAAGDEDAAVRAARGVLAIIPIHERAKQVVDRAEGEKPERPAPRPRPRPAPPPPPAEITLLQEEDTDEGFDEEAQATRVMRGAEEDTDEAETRFVAPAAPTPPPPSEESTQQLVADREAAGDEGATMVLPTEPLAPPAGEEHDDTDAFPLPEAGAARPSAPRAAPAERRGLPWIWIIGALAGLLVLAAAIVLLLRPGEESPFGGGAPAPTAVEGPERTPLPVYTVAPAFTPAPTPLPRIGAEDELDVARLALALGAPSAALEVASRVLERESHSVRALALERAAVGLLPKAPPGPTPRPGCPEPAYGKASRAVARALQNHDYLAAIRALERFRRKCGSYSRASSLLRKVRRLRARWLDEQVAEMTRSYERGDYDMAARIAGAILSKAAPDNSQAIALQSKVERCRQLWTAYRIRLQSAGYDRRIEGLERILALNPTDPQVREERERLLEIKRVEDTRPPKILAPKQVKTSHPDRVEIQVAVSDPTGIKEFTLYYRRTGVFKGRMKQASRDGEGLASVSKIIAIPGEVIKKKDLLVRVRAEDLAGNVAWYPGEGDEVKIQID